MISEAKLDSSFPTGQFHIQSFSAPYKLDISSNGGGLLTSLCLISFLYDILVFDICLILVFDICMFIYLQN